MKEIPKNIVDWINQVSIYQRIPIENLTKYYLEQLNNPITEQAFPKEEDRIDYVNNLLGTHIQEFHTEESAYRKKKTYFDKFVYQFK